MMEWFKYPEHVPAVDEDYESGYLLIACDRAIVPLPGFFDGNRNEFHQLGCPASAPLKGVRAWCHYPKLPAELFEHSPLLLRHAQAGGLIEE